MVWRIDGPQGRESHKIRHKIVPYTRGRGLDLGPGPWKAWPHFISIDNFDEWYDGSWRPDIIGDVTDLAIFRDNSLDFVFSSHVLEHLDDTAGALSEWWRVIKPGGHLVLYLPHKDFYPNIGQEGANPDHKWDFEPQDIVDHMREVGRAWDLMENEDRNERDEYSFFQVYRKENGTGHKFSHVGRALEKRKRLAVIRYGAIGDHLQITTVLPKLYDQGWHITYVTTPMGKRVVEHNPFVDEFWVQEVNQVPNEALKEYWVGLGYEFDKVINLSETIEGTLLAQPDRRVHALPRKARHRLMNVNYFDFLQDVAEVEGPPVVQFFPYPNELTRAQKFKARYGDRPVILWALAGSSIHKLWPWPQEVVVWLLEQTDATVIFAGGRDEQILEFAICQQILRTFDGVSYEDSNEMKLAEMLAQIDKRFPDRLMCCSGAWSVRESLTFSQIADIVVGPETGLLNAVGFNPQVAKVIMLSHSSHENLTRDWYNTTVLTPNDIPCYPCHRMHYSRQFCPDDKETGAAICAASITPKEVYDAIVERLESRKVAA